MLLQLLEGNSRVGLQGFVGLRAQIYQLLAIAAFAEIAVDYSN
jgi:hypothetical protein